MPSATTATVDIITPPARLGPFRPRRLLVVLAFLALALAPGGLGELTRGLMTDAYTQVSAFVATTLILFYGVETLFRFDLGTALSKSKGWQVPIAALLGATPGCGGAVVVVAAYSSGHVGFGAVVAALTSTMGDAAFLLIATRPDAAAVILPMSFAVGIVSGWVVDWLSGDRMTVDPSAQCEIAPRIGRTRAKDYVFLIVAIPGLFLGVNQLLGVDLAASYGAFLIPVGMAGTVIGLFMWSTSTVAAMTNPADPPITRMAEETSFISVWVIGAYLLYDYIVTYGGLDVGALFNSVAPFLPLAGVIVGLIPGCGPQVLVTTLYVNGVIPFSSQIANAISNDGDALFPAIALNPRAAVLATAYSSVPALIVGYGFYFLAPGFMT